MPSDGGQDVASVRPGPVLAAVRRWLLLLAATGCVTWILWAAALPAALLLGPLATAAALAASGLPLRLPRPPFILAQAVIGCLLARAATPALFPALAVDGPLFLAVVLTSIGSAAALGWTLCRLGVLPGSTAIWGTSPGGATAMVILADVYGADVRLVAVMQYLRIACVALAATLVARFFGAHTLHAQAQTLWFPPFEPGFGVALALMAGGTLAGFATRLPCGAMLVPMLVGGTLRLAGIADISLPPWLLAGAYTVIGWRIGLGFTRDLMVYAAKILPLLLIVVATLLGISAGLSFVLAKLTGVDPVTAYLAASPGGLDSIAVIAATTPVDMPFVMTLQTMRFMLVVLLAPPMARFLSGKAMSRLRQPEETPSTDGRA